MNYVHQLLSELAGNLRWIWNGEFDSLFREIDADLWMAVNHNPTAFLLEVDPARLEEQSRDPHYRVRLERACASLRKYLRSDRHWAYWRAPGLGARPVAYFSAEFGMHESLPIYSGGLGILSGDHLKSSSDLGIPIYGVTMLYREGYFHQYIGADGRQEEDYTELDLKRVAISRILDERGEPMSVDLPVDSTQIKVDLWMTEVGRARLLLLDGRGHPSAADPHLFSRRLYGGDLRTRLLQELILGVGGYKALRRLRVSPGVIHMNEGHSAFAVLEAVAETMEDEGLPFDLAAEQVRCRTVFTTHTPVAAGHDRISPELIDEHLAPLRSRLGLSREDFLALGRVRPDDRTEHFCMTVLALKLAKVKNAVSSLNGEITRKMWQPLWPSRRTAEVPIGHVTNGVHVPSWVAPQMAELFGRNLGPNWATHLSQVGTWVHINSVDPFELWDTKCALKAKMLAFVQRRVQRRYERLGLPAPDLALDPQALTIGYARRFVEYKRPTLLFRDLERAAKMFGDASRPVQIVFAGKAHPNDEVGKGLLREVHEYSRDDRFCGRVVLLENYDMNMGRHLVQGCDLWLNTPRRPFEACGTSGMKAVFNATLNLSTLDGWWAEAFDGRNGYAFGRGLTHTDFAVQDSRDSADLMDVLEKDIIPDFYERSPEEVPTKWIRRILHALATLASRYNSDRMVMDYASNCYLPTAGSCTSDFGVTG